MRTALLSASLALPLVAMASCRSASSTPSAPPTPERVGAAESFLFVQDATSGEYAGGRLTLRAVGPTLFFSDRPYRVFGHVDAAAFVEAWKRGPNSFEEDPPNAILSLLGQDSAASVVVVLREPRYSDGDLSYAVSLESGELPAAFGSCSLFIDNEAWAAVGGFAAGHLMARRSAERQAAAFSAGAATAGATARESSSYYYHATAPTAPAPPPPPAPPPSPAASPEAVASALSQAIDEMQAWAKTATPANQAYVQSLVQNLQTVSTDFEKVAK